MTAGTEVLVLELKAKQTNPEKCVVITRRKIIVMGHFFQGDELRLNWVSQLRRSIVTRRPRRSALPDVNAMIFLNQQFQDKLQLKTFISRCLQSLQW